MSATTAVPRPREPHGPPPRGLLDWLTTTNHKKIGLLYIGGDVRLLPGRRAARRADPHRAGAAGLSFLSKQAYNEIFTIHGTTMIFLFIAPIGLGFANYFVPLQIGAPDMAFPRMNALSVWMFLVGGVTICSSFLARRTARRAAGWTFYVPLSSRECSPGPGAGHVDHGDPADVARRRS